MTRLALLCLAASLLCANAGHSQDTSRTYGRTGLELVLSPPPPPPPIDRTRMTEQIEAGCSAGDIRYAGMAAMRGRLPDTHWPDDIRRLASAAAIADDYDAARDLIETSRERATGDDLQTSILTNLHVQTALQFGRLDAAKVLLSAAGDAQSGLPRPLLSDRLFWQAYIGMQSSPRPETWAEDIVPLLDRARAADPTSFQVRMLGVVAFLRSRPWDDTASCHALVGELSDRVLSVTEGSACPLMLGHISHGIDRALVARPTEGPETVAEAWHLLTTGLLAVLMGHGPQARAVHADLEQAGEGLQCGSVMALGFADVLDLAR